MRSQDIKWGKDRIAMNSITLIRNGYVIDPASDREGILDVLIVDDRIRKVSHNLVMEDIVGDIGSHATYKLQEIDASGQYVMPGFIDLHVHLREPGYEYKETIRTGSMAAVAGGYTTICAMPNTRPAIDSREAVELILHRAESEASCNILPIGAITKGQLGEKLSDIKGMAAAGAVAISEDGKSVMDTALYREGMREAANRKLPVFAHCEDRYLAGNGVINEGPKAKEYKLPGISNTVEDVITARDILLSKETGVQLHLCHCSTEGSVRILALARAAGLPVTAEACPHHFTLSQEDILAEDANYKMNPPLRSQKDRKALREALRDDIIDVIATDHAPHSEEEKQQTFRNAPFGVVGLETAFPLTYTELVKSGYLSLRQMVEKMSVNPARILGIERGCLEEGMVADLVIVCLNETYTIDRNTFYSMGRNTPFHGREVNGRVLMTFVSGKLVYQDHKN